MKFLHKLKIKTKKKKYEEEKEEEKQYDVERNIHNKTIEIERLLFDLNIGYIYKTRNKILDIKEQKEHDMIFWNNRMIELDDILCVITELLYSDDIQYDVDRDGDASTVKPESLQKMVEKLIKNKHRIWYDYNVSIPFEDYYFKDKTVMDLLCSTDDQGIRRYKDKNNLLNIFIKKSITSDSGFIDFDVKNSSKLVIIRIHIPNTDLNLRKSYVTVDENNTNGLLIQALVRHIKTHEFIDGLYNGMSK